MVYGHLGIHDLRNHHTLPYSHQLPDVLPCHQVARPITILQRPPPPAHHVIDDGVATDPAVQLIGPAKSMAMTAVERLVGRRLGFYGGSMGFLLGFEGDFNSWLVVWNILEHFGTFWNIFIFPYIGKNDPN